MTLGQFLWGVVTWLTVIIGWMVVADQQNFRELRKDRASRLNDLRDDLLEIEAQAIAFHTAESFGGAEALSLRRELGTVSRELSVLKECRFVETACEEAVIALRQACTDSNQDEKSFVQQEHFSECTGRIMAAREELDDLLVKSLTDALIANKPIGDSLQDVFRAAWRARRRPAEWFATRYGSREVPVDEEW
jgi:hypothetical protein